MVEVLVYKKALQMKLLNKFACPSKSEVNVADKVKNLILR